MRKENYRSVSFVNTDTKIQNELLANLTYHDMEKIHHDQSFFKPRKEFNIRTFVNLNYINRLKKKTSQKSSQ